MKLWVLLAAALACRAATPSGTLIEAPASPYATAPHASGIAVADLNHDGRADLIVVSRSPGPGNVSVLLGNGDGTFTGAPLSPFTASDNATAVAVGDFNGDGNLDVAVASFGDHVEILLGDGRGGLYPAAAGPFALPLSSGYVSLAVADFNHDGLSDVAITQGGTLRVLLSDGAGGFRAALNVPNAGPTVIGDFNADGHPDLACFGGGIGSLVFAYLNNGDGSFHPQFESSLTAAPVTTGAFPTDGAAFDANGDGILDLAVSESNGIDIFLGVGDGSFHNHPLHIDGIAIWQGFAAADIDGDGLTDVISAESSTSSVRIALGSGMGQYRVVLPPFGPAQPRGEPSPRIALADFNGDGRLDLAVTTASGVTVLLGARAGTEVALTLDPGPGPSVHIALEIVHHERFGQPSAPVEIAVNDAVVATVPLDNARAEYTYQAPSPGTYSLRVTYTGDAATLPSTTTAAVAIP